MPSNLRNLGTFFFSITASKGNEGQITYRFSIEDTGIGISEIQVQQLFDKFTQADISTSRKYGGTGLGLSISKELAQLMGGSIVVESKIGVGSTFNATIQLQEGVQSEVEPVLPKESELNGTRVLSIDDNEIARTIIEEILVPYGVEVISVCSGSEALAVLSSDHQFDTIIADSLMPEMSGEELGLKILSNISMRTLPVLIVTSAPQKGDRKRLETAGFSGYLSKPINPEKLKKCIALLASKKKAYYQNAFITQHSLTELESMGRFNKSSKLKFHNAKILLVEDNPINQMVAKAMLESHGCDVTTAVNGDEAIGFFNRQFFDLILMDCQMPVMNGFEATRAIREIELKANLERTAILAFTANAMKGDDLICLTAGMDGYIEKPVKPSDIEKALLEWIPNAKRFKEVNGSIC